MSVCLCGTLLISNNNTAKKVATYHGTIILYCILPYRVRYGTVLYGSVSYIRTVRYHTYQFYIQVLASEMCHWNSIWYIGIGIPLEYQGISEAQVFHGPRGGTRTNKRTKTYKYVHFSSERNQIQQKLLQNANGTTFA